MPTTKIWIDVHHGRLVVCKRFTRPIRLSNGHVLLPPERSDAQKSWLHAAQRCPVVTFRDYGTVSQDITTDYCGPLTLGHPSIDTTMAMPLLVALCNAINQLHRTGLVHGSVSPDHVMVTSSSHEIRLCAGSGLVDDPALDTAGIANTIHQLVWQWTENQGSPATRRSLRSKRNLIRWTRLDQDLADYRCHKLADATSVEPNFSSVKALVDSYFT